MLSDQGREVTLFYVQPGECCVLAASCILPMITFDIALDAAEDSDLLIIDSQAFGTVSQENIHAEAFTYRQATERFSDCMWVMQQVLFMGLDTRLAIWLLDEVARSGSKTIYATHDEIARHLGSAARPSAACSNTSPERDSSNSHAARSSSSMSSAYAF